MPVTEKDFMEKVKYRQEVTPAGHGEGETPDDYREDEITDKNIEKLCIL
jgi:hypothetical protein